MSDGRERRAASRGLKSLGVCIGVKKVLVVGLGEMGGGLSARTVGELAIDACSFRTGATLLESMQQLFGAGTILMAETYPQSRYEPTIHPLDVEFQAT